MARLSSFGAAFAAVSLAIVGSVYAKGSAGPKTYQGTIVIVRTDGIKVNVGQDKPMNVFGIRNANTVVTASGSAATWDDLAEGQYVSLTIKGGYVATVDIGGSAAPPKKK